MTRYNENLAGTKASGTDAHAFVAVRRLGVHRAQIDVPAPLSDVVRVTDVVACARPFAANFANLCHCLLQKIPDVPGETLIIQGLRDREQIHAAVNGEGAEIFSLTVFRCS